MPADPQKVQSLFHEAVEHHAPASWHAFLEGACGGDLEFCRAVEALLRGHEQANSLLDEAAPASATAADVDSALPGAVIGPYKLLEQIGEGGMGTVWMAQQTEPVKRVVALKLIKAGMDSKQVIARFEAERQALALMDHANIARVLDADATDAGRPYFVMDLVKGVPITKYYDDHHLTPRQRLELFIPVCQAIQHAHQKGVIHRDLKPSNVLVALYDGKPVPKVIDFGVAKAAGQSLTDKTLVTGFGNIVGTLEYMSPEQAEINQLDVDTRSDIYSLGVLLYELLAGSPPFSRKELEKAGMLEMLRVIREQEPSKPSKKLSTADGLPTLAANRGTEPATLTKLLRGELDWIVMKALEKDRNRRYETANGFAMDVQRYLNDEPVQACPPSAWYRLGKFARRHKAMAAASGLAASGLLVAVAVFAGAYFVVSDALDSETIERKKAVKLSKANELLADQEGKARVESDQRREQAEALALRLQLEHYFSKLEDRPDLALVGMASLLPMAARFKDKAAAASLRLHLAAWSGQTARLNAICVHEDRVGVVALSADGKTALTGSNDKTARLWETATGKPIGPPLPHQASVVAVALSADGKTALTGSADNVVRLWNTATGKPIGPPLPSRSGYYVALSGDGKSVLLVDNEGNHWFTDTATGKPIGARLPSGVTGDAIALSADGKIASQSRQGGMVLSMDTATGRSIGPPIKLNGVIVALALSADGKFALIPNNNAARLWDTATGEPIGPPMQHRDVTAVALSANGKTALTGGGDRTARLWDTATGKTIGQPLQHQGWVGAVALSADGKTVLTGSWDKTARLWLTPTGTPVPPPRQHNGCEVRSVALSADGTIALTGGADKIARLWQTADGKLIAPPLQHQDEFVGVALSADGKTALTCDGTTRRWEAATGKLSEPLQQRAGLLHLRTALSADGKTAVTVSYHPERGPKSDVINPKTLVNREAQVWDVATGKSIGPPLNHERAVYAVALSADGKTALTASDAPTRFMNASDKSTRLWDTATGKPLGPLQAGFYGVALSADATTVLMLSGDKTARLWDTATGKAFGPPLQFQITVSNIVVRWQTTVSAVALSADGKTVLIGSPDATARLWETATSKPIGPPLPHPGPVGAVTLSADGKTALTGSSDGARVWKFSQMGGDPERIKLWAQLITGLEVDDLTAAHMLDDATWQERRARLEKLGGPPTE